MEKVWDQEWEKNLVDTALQRVRARVKPQHYQIFHLYVIEEVPPRDVARTLKVGIGKVYLIKHRMQKLVEKEIRRLKDHMDNISARADVDQ